MSHQEIQLLRKGENQVRKEIADRQVTGAVACVSAIDSIIDGAKKKKTVITGEDTSQETMSERREKEKSDD